MANVPISAGTGTNIATTSITRDSVTEQMQLVNVGDPASGTPANVNPNGALQMTMIPKTFTITSTLLGASASFTSTAYDTTLDGNSEVDVTAYSSGSSSTANSFIVQSSSDSTNWTPIVTSTVTGGTAMIMSIAIYQRYWRVLYTNSSTAQSGTFTIIATTDTGVVPLVRPNTTHTGAAIPVYLVTGTNTVGTTNPPGVVKGTQGSNGYTVQSLKDAGRNRVILSGISQASTTTETLFTFQKDLGGTITASQTLYTVTSGKTFNLQTIRSSTRYATFSATPTAATITFRLRQTSVTGALEMQKVMVGVSSMSNTVDYFAPPDGLQFPASTVLCFSILGSDTSQLFDLEVIGYEY
jgi:hypothetical protein